VGNKPPKPRPRTRGRKGTLRPCLVCGVVSSYPYCAEHAYEYDKSETERRRMAAGKQINRRRAFRRAGYACAKCGHTDRSGKTLELDHVVQLSLGGAVGPENQQVLCWDCHMDKSVAEQRIARTPKKVKPKNPML